MKSLSKPAHPLSEDTMDEVLADSFPSSDPPSWTMGSDTSLNRPAGSRLPGVVPFLLVAVPLAVLAVLALELVVWRPANTSSTDQS
jgi:hypothetical protein